MTRHITVGDTAGGDLGGTYPNPTINYAVSGILFDRYADVGNVGTGEDDLYSDTIAANKLIADGQKIIAHYSGIFVGHATATRQLKIYFGGTLIYDSTALTTASNTDWDIEITIIRESSTVVRCSVTANTTSASLAPYSKYTRITGLTLSNTQVLKITGEAGGVGAATDDIVAKIGNAELSGVYGYGLAEDVFYDDTATSAATGATVTGNDVQEIIDNFVAAVVSAFGASNVSLDNIINDIANINGDISNLESADTTLDGRVDALEALGLNSLYRNINKTAHGLSVGNLVRLSGGTESGAGVYVLSQADSLANSVVAGIVSAVADADHFTLSMSGYVTGLSGLSPPNVYYLSPSVAGDWTTTRPTTSGQVIAPLFHSIGSTRGQLISGANWQVVP